MMMTQPTGIKLASGEFVEIAGILCRSPLTMKNELITLFNCWNRQTGRKLKAEYFVELILLVGYNTPFVALSDGF